MPYLTGELLLYLAMGWAAVLAWDHRADFENSGMYRGASRVPKRIVVSQAAAWPNDTNHDIVASVSLGLRLKSVVWFSESTGLTKRLRPEASAWHVKFSKVPHGNVGPEAFQVLAHLSYEHGQVLYDS